MVTVEGSVGAEAVLPLRRRIADAIDPDRRQVILDLRAATLVDTATVGLSGLVSRMSRDGMALAIVGIPVRMRYVLDACDVRGVQQYPDLDSARSGVRSA